jgi:hypothetical protein
MTDMEALIVDLKPLRDEAVALVAKWETDLIRASDPKEINKLKRWIAKGTARLAEMDARVEIMRRSLSVQPNRAQRRAQR